MGKCSKDQRDIFYRLSKSEGYRARSAYKLIHLDQHYHLFNNPNQPIKTVVDLCAAPGSWSQVLVNKLGHHPELHDELPKIVAVDLQPMAPLSGVHQLMGDITQIETAQAIMSYFNGQKTDLVVCDGAPDVTGLHDLDEFVQAQLLLAALNITLSLLREGGSFVAKIFKGRDVGLLLSQLDCFFEEVSTFKPKSSRDSSIESFVICRNYKPPIGFIPDMNQPFSEHPSIHSSSTETSSQSIHLKQILQFVACGDLSAYDPIENPTTSSINNSTNHSTQLTSSELGSETLISKLTI
ncbi:uncharacterized protein MELLADRAFT_84132 [Melampsora larici-populina 98AG31]|uniref:Putative tRNA (cytidine(32)/guanosine(34)-2'-O)-methyltransferase n=1 Tax=Melampsora larici-populina (strain 98AG31 / pathotype 3-4-7) TaxID=747676 RepID=F4SBL3_MELLP|nr:uncharacterized protein MELLADRAFT_84132 [Melampsora larici-populina 98AG31]EGF97947.1 hypothetical protein MELLADRAFT_84132 [Melampsora larici-populina 98AG31]